MLWLANGFCNFLLCYNWLNLKDFGVDSLQGAMLYAMYYCSTILLV